MTAAGLRFIIYIPAVTHRAELLRSPFFQVLDSHGKVVGVRDCCPHCRTNRFVKALGAGYNITRSSDPKRNGVRFIYGLSATPVPVSTKDTSFNPA